MNVTAAKLDGVVKRFGGRAALDGVTLDLAAGEVHVLVGPNGAGKTTLLRLLCGLDAPDAGRLLVLGLDLRELSARAGLAHRRRIGFAAQRPYLFDATALANVEYPLRVRGVAGPERRRRASECLAKLGAEHLADRRARGLSAGESRRVALARATVAEPELLLLDEPLATLDPEAVPAVEALIAALATGGATVIAATHALDQAHRLSARVVRLEAGRLAPPAVENILEGEVVDSDTGAELVLAGGARVSVVTDRRGRVRACVAPGDIVLSPERFESSARNALEGRVTMLRERGGVVFVTIDASPRLTSSVTPESCRRLGLTVGSRVVFTFKATAVEVFG